MPDILDTIVAHKREEIAAARRERPVADLERQAAAAPPTRDFAGAIRRHRPVGLIAEVKRASPSAGLIRADFDPVRIARQYADNGAACISVLTDSRFFQGSLDDLRAVGQAVNVPLLRKDFILDRYQILEARAAGADCVLLIAECLDDAALADLNRYAHGLGLQTLIELYEPANLPRVLHVQPSLVGVNNRNLRSFETDLEHCIRLRKQAPPDVLFVGESGIRTRADVQRLADAGVNAILVGETLMRSEDIGAAVRTLLGTAGAPA